LRSSGQPYVCPVFHAIDHRFEPMLVKTHDHVLAANDHRHAARTRDSDHFIQSVAVFADIKLNVLDSLSRKELLRLATVVSSREAVNLDLLHSRLPLGFMLLVPFSIRRLISRQLYHFSGNEARVCLRKK
jgi:hypothetical protein